MEPIGEEGTALLEGPGCWASAPVLEGEARFVADPDVARVGRLGACGLGMSEAGFLGEKGGQPLPPMLASLTQPFS